MPPATTTRPSARHRWSALTPTRLRPTAFQPAHWGRCAPPFHFTQRLLAGLSASWILWLVPAPARAADAPANPSAPVAQAAPADLPFQKDVKPLLEKYCYECHGDGEAKGDVALDSYHSTAEVLQDRATWETVLKNVSTRQMPPDDADEMPTLTEREQLSAWLERELFKYDPAHPDPGHITLHRLNRAEYNNTIRDLVGVDFKPADDFPLDDSGYGFDNNGDVLSLPPLLMEKYLAAAEKVLGQAIVTDPIPSRVQRVQANLSQVGFNAIGDRGDGWVQLISLEEDDVAVELPVLAAGDYLVRVQAFARPAGGAMVGGGNNNRETPPAEPEPTKLAIELNDAVIQEFTLTTDEAHPGVYEARVGIPAGKQNVRAVVRRIRGGANELIMVNGRLGKQQPGIVFVKWIEVEGPLPAATRRFPASQLTVTGPGTFTPKGARVLEHPGEVGLKINADHEGDYLLRAQAYAMQAGTEPARMEFRLDGQAVKTFDVLAPGNMRPLDSQRVFSLALLVPQPQVYEFRAHLKPGVNYFSAAFINEFGDPENENPNLRTRSLTIQNLEVADLSSPVPTPPLPAPLQALFAAHPVPPGTPASLADPATASDARDILAAFTRRAWRRPVQPAELDRLMKLFALAGENGDSFAAGVKLAMKAVLVSPHFLFRNDQQLAAAPNGDGVPSPRLSAPAVAQASLPASASVPTVAQASLPASDSAPAGTPALPPVPIDEFALASRLSYFLWSSTPDDELLDLAGRGALRANLEAQVRRMLASPKAYALVDNFAAQWLQFRSLPTFQPDKTLFDSFDPPLLVAMQRETELFFEYILREDRSVIDFLNADYTFVNERLAQHYGLKDVTGDEFRKVSLADTPRRGVLTQASVLTLTSNPTRTSPVKRGKWVLENILGAPPPPPPPNVPSLDDAGRKLTGTLRHQMEQHRENPVCASCHARMDPIGFGLENFDAIGAWRDKDGDAPIDASGKLLTGDTFKGAKELTDIFAHQRRYDFTRCLSEKMLTYALGRGLEYYDRAATDRIISGLEKGDYKFSSLVMEVVKSVPFQMRRAEPAAPAPAVASARP